jgi:hypothetical protein
VVPLVFQGTPRPDGLGLESTHPVEMARERRLEAAARQPPHLERLVVGGGEQMAAVARERNRPHRAAVRLDHTGLALAACATPTNVTHAAHRERERLRPVLRAWSPRSWGWLFTLACLDACGTAALAASLSLTPSPTHREGAGGGTYTVGSHRRTVRSLEPDAMRSPEGEKATQ